MNLPEAISNPGCCVEDDCTCTSNVGHVEHAVGKLERCHDVLKMVDGLQHHHAEGTRKSDAQQPQHGLGSQVMPIIKRVPGFFVGGGGEVHFYLCEMKECILL